MKRTPIKFLHRLLLKALEKREEKKAWEMWLTIYPDMVRPNPFSGTSVLNFIPFSEYFQKLRTPIKIETQEEILMKVNNIIFSTKFEEAQI